jgi:hypothetical protein
VHPLTQEVLRLLEDYDRVGDVVDHCSAPDYQVLRTLHTLSERGIAEFGRAHIAPSEPADMSALFNESQVRRLRSFAQTGLAREATTPDAKLLVVAANPVSVGRFATVLTKIPGVVLAPPYDRMDRGRPAERNLEALARIDVDGEFGIDLIHFPATPTFEPLCDLAGHRALGTLCLLDADFSDSASGASNITRSLAARPGARNFNVVMLGQGERISPEELRENLSMLDQASLFLLPVESSKDPGSLLRSLFARVVP